MALIPWFLQDFLASSLSIPAEMLTVKPELAHLWDRLFQSTLVRDRDQMQ